LFFHSRIPLSPSFPSPKFPFHPTCPSHSHTSAHILATEHLVFLELERDWLLFICISFNCCLDKKRTFFNSKGLAAIYTYKFQLLS
jgi:hypothetical protein